MKLRAAAAVAAAGIAFASPALAQTGEQAGLLAAVLEGVGQDVSQAIVGGESVFVSASGHAGSTRPTPSPYAYVVQLTASAPTAVEAAGKRDVVLGRLRAAADQYGAAIDVQDPAIAFTNPARPPYRRLPNGVVLPMPSSQVGDTGSAAGPQFEASATVEFGKASPDKEAQFLDALHDAGADNISDPRTTIGAPNMAVEFLGYGHTGDVDPRDWDAAMTDAVANARSEATTLAHAAGRDLGEARQILMLSRSVDSGHATVTVAVRFAFAPRR
jgi:hypothetical protein